MFSDVLFINIEFQNKVDRFGTYLDIDLNFIVPFYITESVGGDSVLVSSFLCSALYWTWGQNNLVGDRYTNGLIYLAIVKATCLLSISYCSDLILLVYTGKITGILFCIHEFFILKLVISHF